MSLKIKEILKTHKGSNLQRVMRVLLSIFIGLVCFVLILTSILTLRKDQIASKILLSLNNNIHGMVLFEDLQFSPFVQFPKISISLSNVKIYEEAQQDQDSLGIPFGNIMELHGALNVKKLFAGKIDISKILIRSGDLLITRYADSSINLIKTFKSKDLKTESKTDTFALDLNISQVQVSNIRIIFNDEVEQKHSSIEFQDLRSSFSFNPESIETKVQAKIYIDNHTIINEFVLRNTLLAFDCALDVSRVDSTIHIDPSILEIGNARFRLDGLMNYNNLKHIDLNFDGSDEDLSFFSIFLTKEGLKNLKAGDLYLKGSVKGTSKTQYPVLEAKFGIDEMHLRIPKSGLYIKDTRLKGYFNSGASSNLSKAIIRLDTISAILPKGYMNGSGSLQNFLEPFLSFRLELKSDISGFEDVFNLKHLDHLSGIIQVQNKFDGQLTKDSIWNRSKHSFTSIFLDSISFSIPGYLEMDQFHGQLSGNLDSINIQDMVVLSGDTDLRLYGTLTGISQFLMDRQNPIIADLFVQSTSYDLSGSLPFVPSLSQVFPYHIKDVYLRLMASTYISNLKGFNKVPEIDFEIIELEGSIEELINPITVSSGFFTLGEQDSTVQLVFKDFIIQNPNGNIQAGLDLRIPADKNLNFDINALVDDLIPGEILATDPADSFPKFMYGELKGDFDLSFELEQDSISRLKKLDFYSEHFQYNGNLDTLQFEGLKFIMDRQGPNPVKGSNPLASLNADIQVSSRNLTSRQLDLRNQSYQIHVRDGVYKLSATQSPIFGNTSDSFLEITPFTNPLWCKLDLKVEQFKIEDFTSGFREDPNLTGPVRFSILAEFEGQGWETIKTNLEADIHFSGHSLDLRGLDIDEFIKTFKRSQNFNLVDVGAVIFAGPVGLAVTKGSDFARILASNPGESSRITELLTDYTFSNGKLFLDDVAFATETNRIVAMGQFNFLSDSLDITIGVVNAKACEIISQQIYGPFKNPELGRVNVIAKLFAPVTNLLKDTFSGDCDPFYTGKLKHPIQPEEEK